MGFKMDKLIREVLAMVDPLCDVLDSEEAKRLSKVFAKCSARYRNDLLEQGFTRDEAIALVSNLQSCLTKSMKQQ